MRAHYLQHVPFEGLGSIEPWLRDNGYEITRTRMFEGEELPDLKQIDLLIIMGGPMSVNDEEKFPWLVQEKRFVGRAVDGSIPVLGICLGAQIIASALGAGVYPGREKEIGWFPVEAVDNVSPAAFQFPAEVTVFHWHGETFDLPHGAVHLARSDACENQAFQLRETVIGLQCHLETTPESAHHILENGRDELTIAPYIQTEEQILGADEQTYSTINHLMADVLVYLTKNAPAQA